MAWIIGIDFDNTIVCYDDLFWQAAREREWIEEAIPRSKEAIRNVLRARGCEHLWTELQGIVYGVEIRRAGPATGLRAFLSWAAGEGAQLFVISHKTQRPFRGPDVNLHTAARDWLIHYQMVASCAGPIPDTHVYFEETKAGKLSRIAGLGCTHFIDDLPEFLLEPAFPDKVRRILYAPQAAAHSPMLPTARSWTEMPQLLRPEIGEQPLPRPEPQRPDEARS